MPASRKNKADARPILIEARDLALGYGTKQIVTDVSLEVRAGDWWFITGANGSGKTTLVRAMLGLLTPLSGQLNRPAGKSAAEMIGFVPQRCDFNHTLPVRVDEFVLLGLTGLRVSRKEEEARLQYALEVVDLASERARTFWDLSGGQRQRALLARALVRQPPILFLDEPTNELDVRARRNFLQLLERIHQEEGVTILHVTHRIELVDSYGSHGIIIQNGKVNAGPKQQVFTKANLDQLFAGGPA